MATAFPYVGPADQACALLLAELQDAHKLLLQAMADLDEIARGPLPTKERIIDARWNISRRSLARRGLWRRIHAHLSSHLPSEDAVNLSRLQDSDMALLRSSTAHVSKWMINAIMKDWPAYCVDSKAIRWKMQAAIGAEIRLLYPMLRAGFVQRR